MRRIFVLALMLIGALVACMGVLLYRPSMWPEVAARMGVIPPDAPSPADRESAFTTPERNESTRTRPVPASRPGIAQQPEPAPFQSASPTSVLYRFPTRGEITIGAAKADILVTFGPPQVSVAGADRGLLQERMIYTEKSTGKKTTIAVINGKVTSADTVAAGDETQE